MFSAISDFFENTQEILGNFFTFEGAIENSVETFAGLIGSIDQDDINLGTVGIDPYDGSWHHGRPSQYWPL